MQRVKFLKCVHVLVYAFDIFFHYLHVDPGWKYNNIQVKNVINWKQSYLKWYCFEFKCPDGNIRKDI